MERGGLPNIVHLSWHDAGRHFGCYGVETVHTPSIDRLAADGVLLERMFSAAAVCSPSRGACLTGRYPQSNGLIHLCHGNFGYRLNEGEKHLSQLLQERGYYTALHGFQHEVNPKRIREELTFFNEYESCDPAPPVHPIPACDVVAEGACAFLERRAKQSGEQPFYLQLGFFESHRPYDFGGCEPDESKGVTVPPYLERSRAAVEDHKGLQGAIRKADAAVGRVLDELERQGLAESTLVVFMPDHGLANPRAKATLYDPGIEIACVMRWPRGGVSGGKRRSELASNVDFVPTLFDLLGWETEGLRLQGESFAGLLGKEGSGMGREHVYALHHDGDLRCARSRRHKLIRNFSLLRQLEAPVDFEAGGHPILQKPSGLVNVGPVELYDLEEDPLETRNMAGEASWAGLQSDLEGRLWRWMEDCGDPILKGGYTTPRHQGQLAEYKEWREADRE